MNRGKLLATIDKNLDDPVALAFSTQGQLWVGNSQPARQGRNWFRQESISVYDPGSQTPIKILRKNSDPQAFVFDSAGNAYVANQYAWQGYGTISVYAPGADTPTRKIGNNENLSFPDALALDAAGNLYVANWADGEYAPNSISVFTASSGVFNYAITQGVFYPGAVAMSGQNLYVANGPPKGVGKLPYGSVTVYPLGATSPSLTITQGIHTPAALAFDSSGNLYVANLNGHSVSVYPPNGAQPIRVISDGAKSPKALAIGTQGDLYVANLYQNSVSVYAPSATKPKLTIATGLDTPNAIALQP